MQKCRIYYRSIKNRKIKEDETGITLVELLAAISILSIVILLAGSVHMFAQRQFIDQSKSASQANDLSYAMTTMSKDLRKKEAETIKVESNQIIEKSDGESRVIYSFENNQLKKGDTVLAEGVTAKFIGIMDEPDPTEEQYMEGESITEGLQINLQNNMISGVSKKYKTTIYFRR